METQINFDKDERTIIAEYVFSHNQDVLIKNDAIKLVDVLNKHNLIENPDVWKEGISSNSDGISVRLLALLSMVLPDVQGKAIMDEYYGK